MHLQPLNHHTNMDALRMELRNASGLDFPISGGTGQSLEDAIILHHLPMAYAVGIENSLLNTLAKARGFRWRLERQYLMEKDGRHYDRMDIMTAPGGAATYYFDITEYWPPGSR